MISSTKSTLTVVIPALNEEEAIAATLTRCLAVSESLRHQRWPSKNRMDCRQ